LGRILAIDYGKKRVGLAVTDPLKIIANSIKTVNTTEIWQFLEDYTHREEVECIVVGYPTQMNNQPSESVIYINPFIEKLKIKYPQLKIELYDERFTSKLAFQTMIEGGVKKKNRQNKGMIDAISATIILQSYLESISNKL
jgi:putative holliday junction resolvase